MESWPSRNWNKKGKGYETSGIQDFVLYRWKRFFPIFCVYFKRSESIRRKTFLEIELPRKWLKRRKAKTLHKIWNFVGIILLALFQSHHTSTPSNIHVFLKTPAFYWHSEALLLSSYHTFGPCLTTPDSMRHPIPLSSGDAAWPPRFDAAMTVTRAALMSSRRGTAGRSRNNRVFCQHNCQFSTGLFV